MKKLILIVIVLLIGQNLANAHTCENETVKCPIDGKDVTFCVTMSMTTFGSFKDFQKQGAIGEHYEELINTCPKCHFSGYIDDFKERISEEDKIKIKEYLTKFDKIKIDDARQCLIAGEIKEFQKKSNKEIAFCYVTGSYLLRENGKQIEFRKELQSKAKDNLISALDKNEYDDKTVIANINYLVAEMERRIGNFDEAIKYYDLAINDPNKKDWVEEVAKEQKELAIKKDENNKI
ncbi:tetratricopeptide repeat protein [Flavobacterium sp. DGU38]|uniref:Tetratricopeptide repeat protein n=1 Tax=Flavobacterium calami TaxID=3139144 RepID=A0ABU9IUN1_9FLAO